MEEGYIGKLGTCLHAQFYEKLTSPPRPPPRKKTPPSTVSGHSLLSGVWEHPLYPHMPKVWEGHLSTLFSGGGNLSPGTTPLLVSLLKGFFREQSPTFYITGGRFY